MDYAFTTPALDRCVELRQRHEEVEALARAPDSRWLLLRSDGSAALADDGRLAWHSASLQGEIPSDWIYLGQQDDRPLFATVRPEATASGADDGRRWLDLRSAASTLDAGQAGILAYARALCAWRERNRFCGACGQRNQTECGGHRLRCENCGAVSFPRTDPAIIVLVRDHDRCLLGRQPGWPAGRYSTLAGFVEPGETLEAAVAREVQEESGVLVADCHYLGSQPWPFPASLMLGFDARATSADIVLGDELEDARWFDPDGIARGLADGELMPPPRLSISRWLIDRWYRDLTGQPLPGHRR